jgi:3-hydroxyanthranilate 3,4-dioxygenase
VDEDKMQFITIKEGSMFVVPGNTPHNPIRFADTVGFVIERKRPEGSLGKIKTSQSQNFELIYRSKDKLRWYCRNPDHGDKLVIIREVSFHVTNLGVQLKAPINVSSKTLN